MAVTKSYLPKNQPQTPTPTPEVAQPLPQVSPAKTSRNVALPHIKNKRLLVIGGVVLLTLLLFIIVVFFFRDNITKKVLGTKTGETQAQTLAKVGKLTILPTGEKVSVATVNDAENLKARQAFFKNAQNGDRLLIYPDKVILYRPSTNQIVEMATINPDQSPTVTPTP